MWSVLLSPYLTTSGYGWIPQIAITSGILSFHSIEAELILTLIEVNQVDTNSDWFIALLAPVVIGWSNLKLDFRQSLNSAVARVI